MEIDRPGPRREGQGRLVRLAPLVAGNLDPGLPGLHLDDLGRRDVRRHEDGRGRLGGKGSPCHRQPVIAARGGDDAGRRLTLRPAEEAVHRAAGLERAGDLQAFELEGDARRARHRRLQLGERRHRRPPHPAGNPLARRLDISDVDH